MERLQQKEGKGLPDTTIYHFKNASSIPFSLLTLASFSNQVIICFVVNSSIETSYSLAICCKVRNEEIVNLVKNFSGEDNKAASTLADSSEDKN